MIVAVMMTKHPSPVEPARQLRDMFENVMRMRRDIDRVHISENSKLIY